MSAVFQIFYVSRAARSCLSAPVRASDAVQAIGARLAEHPGEQEGDHGERGEEKPAGVLLRFAGRKHPELEHDRDDAERRGPR